MEEERPDRNPAQRIVSLAMDHDRKGVSWFGTGDDDRTGYRIAVPYLPAHFGEVCGRSRLRRAVPAASGVLGLDHDHLALFDDGNRLDPAVEHDLTAITRNPLHMTPT